MPVSFSGSANRIVDFRMFLSPDACHCRLNAMQKDKRANVPSSLWPRFCVSDCMCRSVDEKDRSDANLALAAPSPPVPYLYSQAHRRRKSGHSRIGMYIEPLSRSCISHRTMQDGMAWAASHAYRLVAWCSANMLPRGDTSWFSPKFPHL